MQLPLRNEIVQHFTCCDYIIVLRPAAFRLDEEANSGQRSPPPPDVCWSEPGAHPRL